jgi:hypothetical protein
MSYHLASAGPVGAPALSASAPVRELESLGFSLKSGEAPSPGVAIRVSVREALQDKDSCASLGSDLRHIEAAGARLCILPVDLGEDAVACEQWAKFCIWLRDCGVDSPDLCVHSHQIPLDEFCRTANCTLGAGQRFVLLDGLQMHSGGSRRAAERSAKNWSLLWHSRNKAWPLLPVYGGCVRSACPLLADEAADFVLPDTGLQAPAHAAYLPLNLDLARFADDAGYIDEPRLQRALAEGLQAADSLQDEMHWPFDAQRNDAAQNRRLAITITGIGDIVASRREDPADLSCLRELDQTIGYIRKLLNQATATLASERGPVPSLAQSCPPGDWFDGPHNEVWRKRFDAARRKAAVRHRNLLAISPYAVLPRRSHAHAGFTDLLPVIRQADTWAFAPAASFDGWNINQFKHFHKRARAIIQGSQDAAVIAAGV